jgi:hypothetical protein
MVYRKVIVIEQGSKSLFCYIVHNTLPKISIDLGGDSAALSVILKHGLIYN